MKKKSVLLKKRIIITIQVKFKNTLRINKEGVKYKKESELLQKYLHLVETQQNRLFRQFSEVAKIKTRAEQICKTRPIIKEMIRNTGL